MNAKWLIRFVTLAGICVSVYAFAVMLLRLIIYSASKTNQFSDDETSNKSINEILFYIILGVSVAIYYILFSLSPVALLTMYVTKRRLANDNTVDLQHEITRTVQDNLRKYIQFAFPAHITLAACIVVCISVSRTSPFLPVQLMWLSLVVHVIAAIAFGLDNTDPESDKQVIREPRFSLLTPKMIKHILTQTLF